MELMQYILPAIFVILVVLFGLGTALAGFEDISSAGRSVEMPVEVEEHERLARQCRAIVPYGSATALPPHSGLLRPQEAEPMDQDRARPLYPGNAALVGYTFVRHIGSMLDELSSQGLYLWRDERQAWHWRWEGTVYQSERGFWAIGEAVVDAVVTRYPNAFASDADHSPVE